MTWGMTNLPVGTVSASLQRNAGDCIEAGTRFPPACRFARAARPCYNGPHDIDPLRRTDAMCRNIKTLFNFEPPATEDEVHASALQFVRKLSGFNKPSQANAEAFDRAVAEVSQAARKLLTSLHTHAPARDREIEAEKARARARERFA